MLDPETIDGAAPFEFDKTEALLKERGQDWGDPVFTWARVAEVWSGILNYEVTAHQAALCMAGFKLVRAAVCPDNPDSLEDAAAYVRIGQRVVG